MSTAIQLTKDAMSALPIDKLLMEYNLSLKDIFAHTGYTPKTAYPEVVAQYYTMHSMLRVANRYGDVDEANFYASKIMELDNDWFDLTKGKMSLDTVETDDPVVFQKVIKIISLPENSGIHAGDG